VAVYDVYQELNQKLNKSLTNRFPELTFANGIDVPIAFNLAPGAESVSVDEITARGEAGLLGSDSSDIPLVQIAVSKTQAPVVMAVAGYSIGFKSDRAYGFSGKSAMITERSVMAVRRAIDERLNFFIAYGEPSLGIRGFYNNAGVTPIASPFDPNVATYETLVTFFVNLVLSMGLTTFSQSFPTDIIISRRLLIRLANTRSTTQTTMSALEAVQGAIRAIDGYQGVTLRARPESDSAILTQRAVTGVPANRDRIVVYRRDPMVLEAQMESAVAQMMPAKYMYADPKMAMNYPMFACCSAPQIYDPQSVSYVDIVTSV